MLSLDHAHSLLFYYHTDIYIEAAAYLNAEQKKRIRDWTGSGIMRASIGLENPDDLIAGLDQALNARTFKGFVGPLAYQVMKRVSKLDSTCRGLKVFHRHLITFTTAYSA